MSGLSESMVVLYMVYVGMARAAHTISITSDELKSLLNVYRQILIHIYLLISSCFYD